MGTDWLNTPQKLYDFDLVFFTRSWRDTIMNTMMVLVEAVISYTKLSTCSVPSLTIVVISSRISAQ